jgi:hypothetical protein
MTANDWRYTDDRHFHKKRKKARESPYNNMTERLAPGQLRLRRTSSFVFCNPVCLSNYFVRLSSGKFAKKPDQHEMMSGDGARSQSDAWTRAHFENLAAAGEIE